MNKLSTYTEFFSSLVTTIFLADAMEHPSGVTSMRWLGQIPNDQVIVVTGKEVRRG